MKQCIKSFGTCIVSMLVAGSASAASDPYSNWYAGISGDLTWLRHSDTGGGGNIDLGYRFNNNFRLEGEVGYHVAGGESGYSDTHYFTYMGNVYYDFNTVFAPSASGWHVVPYVGGGLGDAQVHLGHATLANTFHNHDNDFAYQGMAGLTFVSASMPNTDWSIGYRYLGTSQDNLHANNLEAGIRFHF